MTSFHSMPTGSPFSNRRYRYNGKERDEETGLYYYGARYYAAWLGRWLSCDPSGADGPNRYSYVRNCPIRLLDPNGRSGHPDDDLDAGTKAQPTGQQESEFAARPNAAGEHPEHLPGGTGKVTAEEGRKGVEAFETNAAANRVAKQETYEGLKALGINTLVLAGNTLFLPTSIYSLSERPVHFTERETHTPLAGNIAHPNPVVTAVATQFIGDALLAPQAVALKPIAQTAEEIAAAKATANIVPELKLESNLPTKIEPSVGPGLGEVSDFKSPLRVQSTGGLDIQPAQLLRPIEHGEKISDITSSSVIG